MPKTVFWISLAGILVLSLLPTEQLPPQTAQVWDKAQHAIGFFWLGLCGHAAYPQAGFRVLAWVLLWGVAIELAQTLTSWRQGDVLDWLADALGAGLATLVWLVWSRHRKTLHG